MKNLSCGETGKKMVLSLYGELDGDEEKLLKTHIRECPACRAEFKELSAFNKILPAFPPDGVPGELAAGIKFSAGRALEKRRRKATFKKFVLRPVLGLAASAVIVFSTFFFRAAEHGEEVVFAEDYEYFFIDEKLSAAENELAAIELELYAGIIDF